ncbi:DNA-processing protein DprA [Pontibacter sp. JAM-7]|uniref:DNA-processing protein DprA n=1 Tax=Pontibacter sp. JAM-7 TaxID=3366581 RepID=UPI003AF7BFA4
MAYPRDWIAAAALPGLGPVSLRRLAERGWPADRLLQASPSELTHLGLKPNACHALVQAKSGHGPVAEALQRTERWLERHHDASVLACNDADYPSLLKQLPDAPSVLFVRGDVSCLHLPQLAMVGSRHASRAGLQHAGAFAKALSQHGFTVTSGLAWGIDSAAHQAAVALQQPTVAVFGTGIDRIYPSRNQALAEAILACGGAWVSELLPGSQAHASHFPKRNRIISGLSLGVLVVEAALRSGSLITARMAMEQGRAVFALPGHIHNPMSKGCHQLIREGATLAETEQDIVTELGPLLGVLADTASRTEHSELPSENLSSEELSVLNHVDFSASDLDSLMADTGLSATQLIPLLMQLELKGIIEQSPIGYCRIK